MSRRVRWPRRGTCGCVRLAFTLATVATVATVAGCASGPGSAAAPSGSAAPASRSSGSAPPSGPSTGSPSDTASSGPAGPIELPTCVDPDPGALPPVSGPAGAALAAGRVVRELSLDGGLFQLAPAPAGATTAVSASLARCTLLASDTAENFPVLDAARQSGFSFALAEVTVADSLVTGHSTFDGVSGTGIPTPPPVVGPYHHRLMWVAVVEPVLRVPCPMMPASSGVPPSPTPVRPPGYQVLAVDASGDLAGIVYSARTPPVCGGAGLSVAYLNPLIEQVSVPWALLARDPGGHAASITVRERGCDGDDGGAWPPEDHPDLVTVVLAWPVADCGPALSRVLQLHSATVTTQLPAVLRHGPTGGQDVDVTY